MKLRVEMRPGDAKGQRVTTEDGELVEGIQKIEWHADAVDNPKIVLTLFPQKVDFDIRNGAEIDE
ncbi:MAG TPA: hypothetical protein VN903_03535 [Polyangia bacterium]|nr:hypothetical protein [Polyangia bacterium]